MDKSKRHVRIKGGTRSVGLPGIRVRVLHGHGRDGVRVVVVVMDMVGGVVVAQAG